MPNSLNAITADVGKISKTVPCDLKFIFDELSEYDNNFLPNLIFLVTANVVSFT